MEKIIKLNQSIIAACDVPTNVYENIAEAIADVEKVGALKTGFFLALNEGLPEMNLEENTVYNHKSGSTDIPDMGAKFIQTIENYPQITGVILTPLSGPKTQIKWMEAAKAKGKEVYIEPMLDTETFFRKNKGYIDDGAVRVMLSIAVQAKADGIILPDNETGRELADRFSNSFQIPSYLRKDGEVQADFNEITAYDVLSKGLSKIVKIAREYTNKPIIYDHQKAGTDIPKNGEKFAEICAKAGIDAVILFPQAGTKTEEAWIKAAQLHNLGVIVGGLMTHQQYVKSEGGYIADEAIDEIYINAANLGVTDFVVPGNKPDAIKEIKTALEEIKITPCFYAPGFVAQGGEIKDGAKAAGKRFHGIVGRGIYWNAEKERNKTPKEIKQAAIDLTSKL